MAGAKGKGTAKAPIGLRIKQRQRPGIEVPLDGGEAMQRMVVLGTGLFRVKREELSPAKPGATGKRKRGEKPPS